MAMIKHGRWSTPSGQSVSSSIQLVTETLVGIYTPSALDATNLKVQVSPDGQVFHDVLEGGAALAVAADVDAFVPLDPTKLLGAAYARLAHVNGAGAAVAEGAERVFQPVFRSFE